jgi:nucleotide-binding universal stress UspA family protein
MEAFLAPHGPEGIPVSFHLDEGRAARAIVDLAETIEADLIVMGSAGRSGLPRLILGSVTERVLRKSPVPVLTVHPPAEAETT